LGLFPIHVYLAGQMTITCRLERVPISKKFPILLT
jgi:hypothetical protein